MSTYLAELIAVHGYALVAVIVGLESTGLPLPGETTLVSAAIYAGTTHQLSIVVIIVAAIVGAIAGDNVGYAVGRRWGYRLVLRYSRLLRMSPKRIALGQYLFARHGGKVVFFGRFIAVLRALAALLAGINRMPWRNFLFFNATGAAVWVTSYGLAGYLLGAQIERLRGPLAIAGVVVAVGATAVFFRVVRRHEAALEEEATKAAEH